MTEVKKETMTHIFLKPCGCLSCALVDVPENFTELAKAYRYAQKHNETYQKVSTEQVRIMEWECKEHKNKRAFKLTNKNKAQQLF